MTDDKKNNSANAAPEKNKKAAAASQTPELSATKTPDSATAATVAATMQAKNTPNLKADKKTHEPPMNAREEWMEFFQTAVIAIILALLIRTFYLEPFNIPSGSMKPTLEVGDYLFVYKPSYGYSRYSFPFGIAPFEGRIFADGKEPKRGDVIVFKLPTNTNVDYIKRIVGLPGDRIQMIDGRLYINRVRVPREPLGLKEIDESGTPTTVMEYAETLPGGVIHKIYEESDDMPLDNTEEYIVPEGHYFAMGDNRDNSQDSRVESVVGYIPLENIIGRASFIFFSTNGYANIAEIWKWPWSIRYNRIFKSVEPVRPKAD